MSVARICPCGAVIPPGSICRTCDAARKRAYDARRPSARQRGYDTRWDKARAGFLAKHTVCAICGKEPATVVDHIEPHKGDTRVFWDRSNWQPSCAPCHNGKKQSQEKGGISLTAHRRRMPPDLKPARIPLTIVCGPAGSGKSTYAREHAGPRDLIIDLAEIKSQLSGAPLYMAGTQWTGPALEQRNVMLRSLATDTEHEHAWLIIGAPTAEERAQWVKLLRPIRLHILLVPFVDCADRIKRDERRRHVQRDHIEKARIWWTKYTPDQRSLLPFVLLTTSADARSVEIGMKAGGGS